MAEKIVIPVALLGLGTVGGGVYELFKRQKDEFFPKTGTLPMITHILVRDKKKPRPGVDPSLLTDRWEDIIGDPQVKIIIEVTGGIEPARSRIIKALEAGKTVITANKDLMAEHGAELFAAAEKSGCDLLFEASVAGGIPIIRPLKQCLSGNHISEVMGIVNGTTNYILTRMSRDGMDFNEALKKAQELGYAEADPTADVEGLAAARDVAYAKEMGCCVKLLAVARSDGESVEARVHPMLIPAEHPLASVHDAFNAVFVHGDAVDDAMFMGRGAGALPTASAVMGDVMEAARNLRCGCTGRIGCTCYRHLPVKPVEETQSRYFLGMQVEDSAGVVGSVASVLCNNGVSIAQIIQKSRQGDSAEIVVITDTVLERNFRDSLTIFREMSMIREISSVLRVYG